MLAPPKHLDWEIRRSILWWIQSAVAALLVASYSGYDAHNSVWGRPCQGLVGEPNGTEVAHGWFPKIRVSWPGGLVGMW